MADIATASINSLNSAVNLLTRAASRLDEQLYSFKDFLKEYQAKNEVANKALFDQYKKLLDDKEKSNKEKKGDGGNILFKDADKQTKTSIKNDVYTPMLTKIGLSMSTQNLKLDQIISIFKEKGKERKDDKSSTDIISLIESFKTAKTDNFVSATEAAEEDSVTLHDVTDTALNKLRTLFTEPQKQQVKGKADDTAGNSGALGKAGNILLIGAAAVAITGFMLVVAKFADIPVANIAKVAAIMGMLGLAIYGLTKINTKALKEASIGLGILALALIGITFGLERFADLDWGTLINASLKLGVFALALQSMNKITGNLKETAIGMGILALALIGLSYGLEKFNSLDWETLINASLKLGVFALSLNVLTKLVPATSLVTLSIGMGVFALALFGLSLALNQFSSVSWESIGKGVLVMGLVALALAALSGIAGPMLLTAAAFGVFALAMMGMVSALTSLEKVDLPTLGSNIAEFLGIMIVPMIKFTLLLPLLLPGVVLFAALGGALAAFGVGVTAVGVGMRLLAPTLPTLSAFFAEIVKINPFDLMLLAPGILALAGSLGVLSVALLAFSGSALISSAVGFIGNIFSGIIPDKEIARIKGAVDALYSLKKIQGSIDLGSVSSSIDTLSKSLKNLADGDTSGIEKKKRAVQGLLDVINNADQSKLTYLNGLISSGKPLYIKVDIDKVLKQPKADASTSDTSNKSLEKAVGAFKEQTGGQLSSMISVLEQLTKILKEKEFTQSNTVVAPTSINSGGNSGASAPVLGPSSINTKALAQSPFSLNGRNS